MYDKGKFEIEVPVKQRTPAQQILWDAAQILRKHGHCKGAVMDEDGRYCWIGALDRAHRDSGLSLDDYRDAFSQWDRCSGAPNQHYAVRWNNAPERTAEDVINAFERAANTD
jgi:hypothetical protein